MSLIATVCSMAFIMILLVMGHEHLDGYKLLKITECWYIPL